LLPLGAQTDDVIEQARARHILDGGDRIAVRPPTPRASEAAEGAGARSRVLRQRARQSPAGTRGRVRRAGGSGCSCGAFILALPFVMLDVPV
jgi:hypothetical protein